MEMVSDKVVLCSSNFEEVEIQLNGVVQFEWAWSLRFTTLKDMPLQRH